MVLSTSQLVVVAFTTVLFTFVVLPRIFGVGIGSAAKESRGFDQRYSRKVVPGTGAARGQPVGMNAPNSPQTLENMQQMKMMMEQEMKSDKYKSNNNKGYVFTLMPLYAIGVGVFAAYKFLKIRSADDSKAQKNKVVKGAKKSTEAENQLNELEQRLAQTEKMLNSLLGQLDPLTNCVKSVAQDQKNEIMSQLQTIRCLMKKRGMDYPPLNTREVPCERSLDDLIESLAARDTVPTGPCPGDDTAPRWEKAAEVPEKEGTAEGAEEMGEQMPEEREEEEEEEEGAEGEGEEEPDGGEGEEELPHLSPEDPCESNVEGVCEGHLGDEQPASGLRRRNRPE